MLQKRKGKKKVKQFTFVGVPIACHSGAETASGRITFSMRVDREKKKFRGKAESEDEGTEGFVKVKGRVKRGGSSGTLRVFGAAPLDDGSVGTNCDTGKLRWSAARA